MPLELFFEGFGIMLSQFEGFFLRKIGFLCGLKVFFHLFYDMLRFRIVLNVKVCRCLADLMGMPADRAELPALEPVNIGKCPASRAPYDEVHGNLVLCFILLKIYRLTGNDPRTGFLPITVTMEISRNKESSIHQDIGVVDSIMSRIPVA